MPREQMEINNFLYFKLSVITLFSVGNENSIAESIMFS